MARPRGRDAPPLARDGRGRVLRDLLLRRGHALLPGPRALRPRRPHTRRRDEQQLCEFWRDWELRLLRPRLIVPIGGIAIKRLLGVQGLAGCVGQRYERDGATVVPLPHPSGASSWLNAPANRELVAQAVEAIRDELKALGSSGDTGG